MIYKYRKAKKNSITNVGTNVIIYLLYFNISIMTTGLFKNIIVNFVLIKLNTVVQDY